MSEFEYGELGEPDLEEIEELVDKDEDELTDKEVTSKIKLSIKRRFDFPTWLIVFEFQNRDGRRADCLAMNTRASRNFPLVGFEFKASRNDWLAEKRDHEKADFFVQLCDEWYVVAGRRGIVKEGELPDGWGLLELKPSGRIYKLQDSSLNDMQDAELDRRFFTRFMKKAMGNQSNFTYSDIKEAEKRGVQRAKEKYTDDRLDREAEKLHEKAETVDKLIDADLLSYFQPITNERVKQHQTAKELVKLIEGGGYTGLQSDIERMEQVATRNLHSVARQSREMVAAMENIRESLEEGTDDV